MPLFGVADDPLHFQLTAPIQPGNSGGPIVNDSGQLVGVAVASLDKVKLAAMAGILPENVNFGIHLDVVKRFLSDLKIEMPTINGSFDPELSCVQIVVSE